jgi:hypothetical protein
VTPNGQALVYIHSQDNHAEALQAGAIVVAACSCRNGLRKYRGESYRTPGNTSFSH